MYRIHIYIIYMCTYIYMAGVGVIFNNKFIYLYKEHGSIRGAMFLLQLVLHCVLQCVLQCVLHCVLHCALQCVLQCVAVCVAVYVAMCIAV